MGPEQLGAGSVQPDHTVSDPESAPMGEGIPEEGPTWLASKSAWTETWAWSGDTPHRAHREQGLHAQEMSWGTGWPPGRPTGIGRGQVLAARTGPTSGASSWGWPDAVWQGQVRSWQALGVLAPVFSSGTAPHSPPPRSPLRSSPSPLSLTAPGAVQGPLSSAQLGLWAGGCCCTCGDRQGPGQGPEHAPSQESG